MFILPEASIYLMSNIPMLHTHVPDSFLFIAFFKFIFLIKLCNLTYTYNVRLCGHGRQIACLKNLWSCPFNKGPVFVSILHVYVHIIQVFIETIVGYLGLTQVGQSEKWEV